MGGLLVKYILTSQENEELRANTRGCVFFSVPHFGAELGLLDFILCRIFHLKNSSVFCFKQNQ